MQRAVAEEDAASGITFMPAPCSNNLGVIVDPLSMYLVTCTDPETGTHPRSSPGGIVLADEAQLRNKFTAGHSLIAKSEFPDTNHRSACGFCQFATQLLMTAVPG